jgi:hypothetical protein
MLTKEQKSLVKKFFLNKPGSSTSLKSVPEVKAFFDYHWPDIGKLLSIRTLEDWKVKIRKELLNISQPPPKKHGPPSILPLSLITSIIEKITELGKQGTPMNSTILRPYIETLIIEGGNIRSRFYSNIFRLRTFVRTKCRKIF